MCVNVSLFFFFVAVSVFVENYDRRMICALMCNVPPPPPQRNVTKRKNKNKT